MKEKIFVKLLTMFTQALINQQIKMSCLYGNAEVVPTRSTAVKLKNRRKVAPLSIEKKTLEIEMNINSTKDNTYKIVGGVSGYEQATFVFYGNDKKMEGYILFFTTNESYFIDTDINGDVYMTPNRNN